jgi:hypothetical protein
MTIMAAHPNFDDGGTLLWETDLDAAFTKARQSGKALFIESGRQT